MGDVSDETLSSATALSRRNSGSKLRLRSTAARLEESFTHLLAYKPAA